MAWKVWGSNLWRQEIFYAIPIQTSSAAYSASCTMGTVAPPPGTKQVGGGNDHPHSSSTEVKMSRAIPLLYHYSPLCLHGTLFANFYPFNPYTSGSDTSGIKMLIVKSRLNNQQKMDCEGNPPFDFQGTEETSEQINNETVEMMWQRNFGMEDTVSLTQLI
jgi:hypothetical protein